MSGYSELVRNLTRPCRCAGRGGSYTLSDSSSATNGLIKLVLPFSAKSY